ncbi:MAG: hypothetical protein KDK07_08415 [Bauldia sp.]|nr:hypothetical protein [Bauldia sp.]
MTGLLKKIAVAIVALAATAAGMEIGESLNVPGVSGPVSAAHAIVGRPLTPVSVAGVGRRTVRRCAVGVYNC